MVKDAKFKRDLNMVWQHSRSDLHLADKVCEVSDFILFYSTSFFSK